MKNRTTKEALQSNHNPTTFINEFHKNFATGFISFLFFVIGCLPLQAQDGTYKIESLFTGYDGEKKIYLLTLFLPYNPHIVSNTLNPSIQTACDFWWPKGYLHTDKNPSHPCDLLWIESENDELSILYESIDQLKQASAVFTSTHFFDRGIYYQNLKLFLELSGFTLLGHWYWENQKGEAMFIRKELLAAAMRTLNYTPCNFSAQSSAAENNLQKHFQKADHKSPKHSLNNIDFIYMINLDERPEKFDLAYRELSQHGIYPYRFSAVNGWKLPTSVLNQVGVRFSSHFNNHQFLGSIYREIDGREYLGHEIIRPNGETFFTLGMSHGAIGIILSHLSVLQDAYDSGYQTIWIMEDDIEAVDDPKQIPSLIQQLDTLVPDWDILFTDTDTKDRAGNHVPCRAVAARPNLNIPPLSSFLQHFYSINNDFSRIGMRYGAYSMIVRRSGMEKILQHFKTYGIFIPYDMDFWLNPEIKMYCVNKDIISHRAGAPTDNSEPHYLKKRDSQ